MFLSAEPGGLTAFPVLAALALGAQRLLPLVQQGYAAITQVQGGTGMLDKLLGLLELPPAPESVSAFPAGSIPFSREIVLAGVSFRYNAIQREAIRNVNLVIPQGSRVGLIGRNRQRQEHDHRSDHGSAGAEQRLDHHRRRAAGPEQSPRMAQADRACASSDFSRRHFHRSHIAFGCDPRAIDMARVKDAAREAEIAEFIEGLPEQYSTRVGERGVQLSGGQRQRIGIARALYKRPSILILNEAFNALDSETEAAIMRSIEALGRSLTIILISHRMHTVEGCDSIIRLENGMVAREHARSPARGNAVGNVRRQ